MSYPKAVIYLSKLTHNTKKLVEDCRGLGITIMGVNKVFNGAPQTALAMAAGGMEVLAESKVENLMKLDGLPFRKTMLRTPGISEADKVVRYADISLVGNPEILKHLSREAVSQNRVHQVMPMIDMGDLREGIWFENLDEIEETVRHAITLPNLSLYGLGTNFGCYGTILATVDNTTLFVEIAKRIERKLGIHIPYLSGGNGSTYYLAKRGILPREINHLRIGGQHIFGIEYVEGKYLDGYFHSQKPIDCYASDAYLLQAEVVEIRDKPSVPVGIKTVDAFMKKKTFPDEGVRRMALLNFGLQDVPSENLYPCDAGIRIMGQTSNHTILDVTMASKPVSLGEAVLFEVDYTALMHICNAPGIEKTFICDEEMNSK